MSNGKRVAAVLVDCKNRFSDRQPQGNKGFDVDELMLMFGTGTLMIKPLVLRQIQIGKYIIKNPSLVYNTSAKLIPLDVNTSWNELFVLNGVDKLIGEEPIFGNMMIAEAKLLKIK